MGFDHLHLPATLAQRAKMTAYILRLKRNKRTNEDKPNSCETLKKKICNLKREQERGAMCDMSCRPHPCLCTSYLFVPKFSFLLGLHCAS